MKYLSEFIKESIINESANAKNSIRRLTSGFPEVLMDASPDLDYYNAYNLGQDDSDVDPKEFNKRLAAIHKMVSKTDDIDLDDWSDNEEWDQFYNKTRLNPSKKIMVMHNSKNGVYIYIVFKSFKQKAYNEFKEMLSPDFDVYENF